MGWNRANRSSLGGGAVGVPIHQTAGQRLWSTAQRFTTKILQAGPRDAGRSGQQQHEREQTQRERRRVEHMDAPASLCPSDEVFRRKSNGNQQKLKIEPVRSKPKKQIDAQDDRNWREPERIGVASRKCDKHVERVRKEELRDNQVRRVVDLAPVPPPVQEDRCLRDRLNVMLLLEDDVDGEYPRAPDGRGEQEGVPRTDEGSSPPEGPQQMRVSHHGW